jgi:hypothetical protein
MGHRHRYPGSSYGTREEELKRWLGYIETHIDSLAELLMEAYPRTSPEYHYARWTRVRLHFFLNVVRVKLGFRPQ